MYAYKKKGSQFYKKTNNNWKVFDINKHFV